MQRPYRPGKRPEGYKSSSDSDEEEEQQDGVLDNHLEESTAAVRITSPMRVESAAQSGTYYLII